MARLCLARLITLHEFVKSLGDYLILAGALHESLPVSLVPDRLGVTIDKERNRPFGSGAEQKRGSRKQIGFEGADRFPNIPDDYRVAVWKFLLNHVRNLIDVNAQGFRPAALLRYLDS